MSAHVVANGITWTRQPLPDGTPLHRDTQLFRAGYLTVLLSRDRLSNGDKRWHISISHPFRNPSWDEIKSARYQLVPNSARMTMDLPPVEEFVNLHEHCFHLYECRCSQEEIG